MKKLIYAILIVLFIPFFNSCTKKSANDPLISLKSRDARITGEWKLVSWETTSTTTSTSSGSSNSSTTTSNYDGTLVTNVDASNNTSTYTYSLSIEISKDGTYTSTEINSSNDTSISTGEWWWLDNNKKKTRIAFDDDYSSWNIDKLGNKTLIVVNNSSIEENDSDGDTYVYTATRTYTYEKQ